MSKFYNLLIKDRIFIFSSLALLIPLILFSVNGYEEYDQGIYSARYMYSDILNFFSNFNIKLGMGSTFPIGQGLFFYPTSFFSFNLKLFITTTVILNSLIQYSYFKKICIKILKIKNNNFFKIVSVLLIISLPNLSYNYIDDWISMYTSYTILFPLIYYTIKYQKFYSVLASGYLDIEVGLDYVKNLNNKNLSTVISCSSSKHISEYINTFIK